MYVNIAILSTRWGVQQSRALNSLVKLSKAVANKLHSGGTADDKQKAAATESSLLRELVVSECRQSTAVVVKEIRTTSIYTDLLPKNVKVSYSMLCYDTFII
jgi:hypothetical protein